MPAWLEGGPEPSTVSEGRMRPGRLRTLRSRLSAAREDIHALLMARGARDFRSGRPYEETMFFDEYVDIHRVFPKAWCRQRKIPPKLFDTVLDKTRLGYETNRIPGGLAPSGYLARLEKGSEDTPPIRRRALDE